MTLRFQKLHAAIRREWAKSLAASGAGDIATLNACVARMRKLADKLTAEDQRARRAGRPS